MQTISLLMSIKKTSFTICTWIHDKVYTYLPSQKTGENRSAFKSREFMSVELGDFKNPTFKFLSFQCPLRRLLLVLMNRQENLCKNVRMFLKITQTHQQELAVRIVQLSIRLLASRNIQRPTKSINSPPVVSWFSNRLRGNSEFGTKMHVVLLGSKKGELQNFGPLRCPSSLIRNSSQCKLSTRIFQSRCSTYFLLSVFCIVHCDTGI